MAPEEYERYGATREVVYWGVCLDARNETFKDYYVHARIQEKLAGIVVKDQEWFVNISLARLIAAFNECRREGERKVIYVPRAEQRLCIDALTHYFTKHPFGERFLLNCKMRFGKCYTTYKFAEEMGLDRILILTFVPAVELSWRDDLAHIKKSYAYYTDDCLRKDDFDLTARKDEAFVLFLSLQNYLGKDAKKKETKARIRKLQSIAFDLVVLDEYHFGAWNERTRETLEDFDPDYLAHLWKHHYEKDEIVRRFGIQTRKLICLSGTPFKALARGDFAPDQTFTYSYFDEQMRKYPDSEKAASVSSSRIDPAYRQFPDMKILGYNMSEFISSENGAFLSTDKLLGRPYFSLNRFFRTKRDENPALGDEFVYENEIRLWLSIIKGQSHYLYSFPFAGEMQLLNRHTLWLLPTRSACKAMEVLLKADPYFSRFVIANLSGDRVGTGPKALAFLRARMKEADNCSRNGSIAITVNKLTLGVTVPDWSAVFVLKDLASPETYFQSIFRIQTPNASPFKEVGLVYDFNIDRAAALMLEFAKRSRTPGRRVRLKTAELIVKYMPIYRNGDLEKPIDYEVFEQLALFGSDARPFSKRIGDLKRTTRVGDDETLASMLADPRTSEVLKKIFAHAKFRKKSAAPDRRAHEPPAGSLTQEYKTGLADGHAEGLAHYQELLDFSDLEIQTNYERLLAEYLDQYVGREPVSLYEDIERKINYQNGFRKGFAAGVNVPIRNLNCGSEDGTKFAMELRKRHGPNLLYQEPNKLMINNAINEHLNDLGNIPQKYRNSSLLKHWYHLSFMRAVRQHLSPPRQNAVSVDAAENALQHIIARLFQFLYISVYRETTFAEIFNNADPEVFLEAVGITKNDFAILDQYRIFQEDVLNNFIREFFRNEALEIKTPGDDEAFKEHYRNSFNWFGFHDVSVQAAESDASFSSRLNKDLPSATEEPEARGSDDKRLDDVLVVPSFSKPDVPACLHRKVEIKVYLAACIIASLEEHLFCAPTPGTIKDYLMGNVNGPYYPYFKDRPEAGSVFFLSSRAVLRVLQKLVRAGLLFVSAKKKEAYYPLESSAITDK